MSRGPVFKRQGESVLVVSGNERHGSVDRKMLKQLGYTNTCFQGRSERALEHVASKTPDLLIVGGRLDDMEGVDFVNCVRKEFEGVIVPSVMVTLRNRRSDVLAAISAGCAGYVLRPYSLETFGRHIEVALRSTRHDDLDVEQLDVARSHLASANFDDAIAEFKELFPIGHCCPAKLPNLTG